MGVGKLTRRLLDQCGYPDCLNIAFGERFSRENNLVPATLNPLKAFFAVRSRQRIAMAVWFVLMVTWTLGFLVHDSQKQGTVGLSIVLYLITTAGTSTFFWGRFYDMRCLQSFEHNLDEVLRLLSFIEGARPVYLMTLEEVRDRAREAIMYWVTKILESEKENGQGSAEAERYRENLRETYDLFREYGLTPETEDGYRGYFATAQESLTKEAVPE